MSFARDPRVSRWALLLPIAATVIAYGSALQGSFVRDDHVLIEAQPQVQHLASPVSYFGRMFWSDPFDPSRSFYRPLTTLSFAIDWALSSGSPGLFHATNLLLHLLVTVLLFFVCRRSGAGPLASAAAASLFAVHPRLTESVAWISGRTDLLAALFVLLALLLHDTSLNQASARRWASAGSLLLGLFCKEVALAGVVGIAVQEAWHWRTDRRRERFRHLVPAAVAVIVYLAARIAAARSDVSAVLAGEEAPLEWSGRLLAGLGAIGEYARMLAWPWNPELLIGDRRAPHPALLVAGALVLAGACFAILRGWRKLSEWQAAAAATGLSALLMVLHLVPLNMQELAADRFLYLPLAMLAVLLVRPLERLAGLRGRIAAVAIPLLLVSFVAATMLRVSDWADEYALWKKAVEQRTPGNSRVLLGLATVLMDADLHGRALPYLEQAMREQQSNPDLKTWNAYAVVLDKLGRHDEALELFTRMAEQQPTAFRVKLNLAMSLARTGRFADAIRLCDELSHSPLGAETSTKVREVIAEAQRRTVVLGEAESTEALAERASVADLLGATSDAERSWRRVLHAPDANGELRRRAAGYLAFHGDPVLAAKDLELFASADPGAPELPALESAVEDRNRLR